MSVCFQLLNQLIHFSLNLARRYATRDVPLTNILQLVIMIRQMRELVGGRDTVGACCMVIN
jgi:hypothetical protein